MLYTFTDWYLYLIIYSFVGWVYESLLCYYLEKKWVNRGFLRGPVCPIYGVGALAILLVMNGRVDGYLPLFLIGAALTCSIEYLTSILLEKLFHARWWDYSDHRFNFQGRVCLLGAVAFGSMAVALIKWIHPFVARYLAMVPPTARLIAAAVILAVMLHDLTVTVSGLIRMESILEQLQKFIAELTQKSASLADEAKEALREKLDLDNLPEQLKALLKKQRRQLKRLTAAFPGFRHLKYDALLKSLKNRLFKN